MVDWIRSFIQTLGYSGIALLMFVENVFPPIPSELIMPFAGFVAAGGTLSFVGIVIAGTVGSVLGALPLYYVGHAVGLKRLQRWVERHGHWFLLSVEDLERSQEWFRRYGPLAVFLCRLVPGIRSLISIPAGVSGMNMPLFLVLSLLGTSIWSAALAWLGYVLGQNYELVSVYLGPVTYVVFGGLVLWYVVGVVKRIRERKGA